MSSTKFDADVIVVGGGPAGLSGAMQLARCLLRVFLFDTGRQRNLPTQEMHGYLTQKGITPHAWLELARQEAKSYGVRMHHHEVRAVVPIVSGFEVHVNNKIYRTRKLLMATGVRDRLPDISGLKALYGKSVFHCPYCDGWGVRNKALGAFGYKSKAVPLALLLRSWSANVTLFTQGPAKIKSDDRQKLERAGITVCNELIEQLVARANKLTHIQMESGERIPCDALFFSNGHTASSTIMADLGCAHLRTGAVITDRKQRTRLPGLFVAGDASIDTHMVSVACAEGMKAAITIHQELLTEDGVL